jgi:hypothetical protein
MLNTADLRCENCGSADIAHVQLRDRRGRTLWKNRCRSCCTVSEYVPTLADIRAECRRIRLEQDHLQIPDEQERAWRRQHAAFAWPLPEEDEACTG